MSPPSNKVSFLFILFSFFEGKCYFHKIVRIFHRKNTIKRAKSKFYRKNSNKNEEKTHFQIDYDLPGNGQFYCIECERHFVDEKTRQLHRKTKLHKNRVKTLKEVPYTQAEANAAGGSGFFPAITLKTRVELPKQPEIPIPVVAET